jgi:hypothetical protein
MNEWRDNAACWDSDPELFFNHRRVREALQTCDECNVTNECFDYAKQLHKTSQAVTGVWGGHVFTPTKPRKRKT